ncbi:BON domain-containing protein [Catellatospora tritici]|uniref:BON domain-containing protein n=1 Tax=Catellatospora tritici TaxID=2851566 RepID=UPI0027DFCC07|nr:BON domain-containing protein [Catellatospora tritici]
MNEHDISDEYIDAAVQRMLTEDDEISEQGIEVVWHGGTVVLRGQVECASRREAIEARVLARFPDRRVCNDISVTAVREPAEPEVLS